MITLLVLLATGFFEQSHTVGWILPVIGVLLLIMEVILFLKIVQQKRRRLT